MTTIAYRAGVIASDSRMTDSDVIVGDYVKIWKNKEGWLAGGAGKVHLLRPFQLWFNNPKVPFSLLSVPTSTEYEYSLILVSPKGKLYSIDAGVVTPDKRKFAATGSGWKFALGALAHGATAVEAVKVAIQFDVYSGLPVQTLSLK